MTIQQMIIFLGFTLLGIIIVLLNIDSPKIKDNKLIDRESIYYQCVAYKVRHDQLVGDCDNIK